MRKIIIVLFTVLMFVWGSAMAAPPAGEIVTEGSSAAPPFKVLGINPQENAVKIFFPIMPSQYETEKKGEKISNPEIQVYASYAHYDAATKKWQLVGKEDFRVQTKAAKGGVAAYIKLPKKGNWFWIRTWAKDLNSGNWIWIDKSSDFCRLDTDKNPGYEFLVNIRDQKFELVPKDYKTRE